MPFIEGETEFQAQIATTSLHSKGLNTRSLPFKWAFLFLRSSSVFLLTVRDSTEILKLASWDQNVVKQKRTTSIVLTLFFSGVVHWWSHSKCWSGNRQTYPKDDKTWIQGKHRLDHRSQVNKTHEIPLICYIKERETINLFSC